jgi:TrmH family RNA methyltransferase
MRREITGFSNPLLKEIRGLREKKLRKRAGLFLAEGLRIMTEAREAGFLPEMLFRFKDRPVHALEIALEDEVLRNGGDVNQRRHHGETVRQRYCSGRRRCLS